MERKPNTIAITGVPGVGKDFLIDQVTSEFDAISTHSTNRIIKGMLTSDEIDIRRLSINDDLSEHNKRAALEINRLIEEEFDRHHIVNTHVTHRRIGGLAIDNVTLPEIVPRDIIMIENDPDIIYMQRKLDANRNRPIETIKEIEHQQNEEKKELNRIARQIGSRVLHLINTTENLPNNILNLASITRGPFLACEKNPVNTADLKNEILSRPNSRINLLNYPGIALSEAEHNFIKGIPKGLAEIEKANIIYNWMCQVSAYDESFYLNFSNPERLLHHYKRHFDAISEIATNKKSYVTCQEMALKLATMLKVATGKSGYLENSLPNGTKQAIVPHTTFVISLLDATGKNREVVFDPFSEFSHSDTLRKSLGMDVNLKNRTSQNKQEQQCFYSLLIEGCCTTDQMVERIKEEIKVRKLDPVEESSFVKGVLRYYAEKNSNVVVNFSRFSTASNNETEEEMASVFQIRHTKETLQENKTYVLLNNSLQLVENSTLKKCEEIGLIKCISLNRHVIF